jgi:hypothetical protein
LAKRVSKTLNSSYHASTPALKRSYRSKQQAGYQDAGEKNAFACKKLRTCRKTSLSQSCPNAKNIVRKRTGECRWPQLAERVGD